MSFDPSRVSTVTFDSYSTLVDVDAAEKALAAHVTDPEPVSKLWRARSLEYTFVGNHIDEYRPFYEVNRAALQYALDASNVSLSASERDDILSVYHELDVFDDVRESIERLQAAGYGCYVVSNGNPAMLDSMVKHAEIESLLDGVISADEIATFKPDAELYRHAANRTETPIDEIAHATAAWFDVMGAQHAGMQGVWVDRKSSPWEPFGPEPDLTVPGLSELADELGV